ncbi:MAG: hypothetical protein COA78_33940 [Blastopirellula sp.]|nr:MAG: hypothetical protein COA78_33940 [Blastopirellula sp.]
MHRLVFLLTILSLVILNCSSTIQAQGLLSAVSDESRAGSAPSSSSDDEKDDDDDDDDHHNSHSSHGSSHGHYDGAGVMMGLYATGVVVTSPYWIPIAITGDDYTQPGLFQRFPNDITSGYMLKGEEWSQLGKPFSIRASTEYGTDFNNLSRSGTKFLIEGTHGWGLDTQWNQYFEDVPAGGTDELTTGDINVVFRFAESYFAQFRTGLGVNMLSDQVGTEWGLNFTYGADIYPCDNVIWSSELDLGKVGTASFFNIRTTAGLQWKRAEIFGGFQHTNYEGTELNGLITGIRLWF